MPAEMRDGAVLRADVYRPGANGGTYPTLLCRTHNTGADFWSDDEFRVARQTLFRDRERPSRLILPIVA